MKDTDHNTKGKTMSGTPVQSGELQHALGHVASGGRLAIPTAYHLAIITQKNLDRWLASGRALLVEEGRGFRMRRGRSSVYLFPGQLFMVD